MKKFAFLALLSVWLALPAASQSYPSVVQLQPATATQPCSVGVAVANKTVAICPQAGTPNIITVDFGDGKGYVNPFTAGAVSISIGTTTTLAAGAAATVTNTGTPQAPVLNFGIPQGVSGATGVAGKDGTNGANGTSATVAVGTTTVGTTASVTNSGTANAAVLNFVIPQGPTWSTCTGVTLTPSGVGVYTLVVVPANCK